MTPWFNLLNVNSGKGLDVKSAGTANGTDLQQWAVTGGGGAEQKFRFDYTREGDYFSIIPKHAPSKAVEITNSSSGDNTVVQTWEKPSSGYMNSQKFRMTIHSDGSCSFTSHGSGYNKVISVKGASTANGAAAVLFSGNGATSRCWNMVAVKP